jgi:hypothetical protein
MPVAGYDGVTNLERCDRQRPWPAWRCCPSSSLDDWVKASKLKTMASTRSRFELYICLSVYVIRPYSLKRVYISLFRSHSWLSPSLPLFSHFSFAINILSHSLFKGASIYISSTFPFYEKINSSSHFLFVGAECDLPLRTSATVWPTVPAPTDDRTREC